MIPHQSFKIAAATKGKIREIERVSSGFYISQALEFRA
jgi:magnesium-protoporphyrin O-methyltransferase